MNSRERILAAINHERLDRIPTDIWATPEVWDLLGERFGQESDIFNKLHIDWIAQIPVPYSGPAYPPAPDGELYGHWGYWGVRDRVVQYEHGVYHEQACNPLANVRSLDDLSSYEWPSADWFDYVRVRELVLQYRENHAVACGYMAPFYIHNMLRGLEQSLVDPYEDPELAHAIITGISNFLYEQHQRIFEMCDGLIDISQVTDDFGSQNGPLISLATFREFYKPHMQRFIDLCHGFNIKVFHHDDGAMRQFLPDLVEMGIEVLNPIQHECPGMDMSALKSDFGDRIAFHGGVENQKILPFGTTDDVRKEVRDCIDSLASDRTGYILAPCHNIQPVTPLENIIAMYDEAWNYGKF